MAGDRAVVRRVSASWKGVGRLEHRVGWLRAFSAGATDAESLHATIEQEAERPGLSGLPVHLMVQTWA